jgi:hypothetical protein
MPLRPEWLALETRARAFLEAGRLYVESLVPNRDDPYNVADKQLLPQAYAVFDEIGRFVKRYANSLPGPAVECFTRFVSTSKDYFAPGVVKGPHGVRTCLVALAAFASEFSYHLADFTTLARRLSIRAFTHLQRSIVADADHARRWQTAFQEGERECEKLGASHLLLHGIWAFKVSAEGERTDLVFGEPLRDLSQVEAAAEVLVLTEWKVVRRGSELDERLAQAHTQASRYAAGVLGGLELTAYRYLVLVSESHLAMPADAVDGEVTYHHVHIAVVPTVPSKAIRQR